MTRQVPDSPDTDAVLEYAAQLCEEMMVEEVAGMGAKKKRVREDAALRSSAIRKTRQQCAAHIRAFKSRRDLDATAVLARIAELKPGQRHDMELGSAWPLAWKGWVKIECRVDMTGNSIPPGTEYTITLTDRGRKVLRGQMEDA